MNIHFQRHTVSKTTYHNWFKGTLWISFQCRHIYYLLPGFEPATFDCPCPEIHRNKDGSLSRTPFLSTGWWGCCSALRGSWCLGEAMSPHWVGRTAGIPGHTETDGRPEDKKEVSIWGIWWSIILYFSLFSKCHSHSRTHGWKMLSRWWDLEAGRPPLPAPFAPACGPHPDL